MKVYAERPGFMPLEGVVIRTQAFRFARTGLSLGSKSGHGMDFGFQAHVHTYCVIMLLAWVGAPFRAS